MMMMMKDESGQTMIWYYKNTYNNSNTYNFFDDIILLKCMYCRKAEMEDKVISLSSVNCIPHWSFFAVCDGHGGDFVSQYLSDNLADILSNTIAKKEKEIGVIDEDAGSDVMINILNDTCQAADLELSKQSRMKVEKKGEVITCKDPSGSTSIMCLISKLHIVVANVGDSRALLAQWGTVPISGPLGVSPGVCDPLGGSPGVNDPLGDSPGVCASPPHTQKDTVNSSIPTSGILIAKALSVDHKFSIIKERERAERADAT